MGNVRCYWPGGPLDPYRRACMASYGRHGHSLEFHCHRAPEGLPAGVTIRPIGDFTATQRLEAHLISGDRKGRGSAPCRSDTWTFEPWNAIEVLQLGPQHSSLGAATPPLAWIEAFKLWLPEFAQEMRQRAKDWPRLPLHLSFAALADLDLHCLPPAGSFLAELLTLHTPGPQPLPSPHHSAEAVRQSIHGYLISNQSWSLAPLQELCSPRELLDLQLITPPSLARHMKRVAKGWLNQLTAVSTHAGGSSGEQA